MKHIGRPPKPQAAKRIGYACYLLTTWGYKEKEIFPVVGALVPELPEKINPDGTPLGVHRVEQIYKQYVAALDKEYRNATCPGAGFGRVRLIKPKMVERRWREANMRPTNAKLVELARKALLSPQEAIQQLRNPNQQPASGLTPTGTKLLG